MAENLLSMSFWYEVCALFVETVCLHVLCHFGKKRTYSKTVRDIHWKKFASMYLPLLFKAFVPKHP